MTFNFIASTGRTATTYLASVLNEVPQVCACHEGYVGGDKAQEPLLPLINLENAQAYSSQSAATRVVDEKRSPDVLTPLVSQSGKAQLIDVAYYNATLASAMLAANSNTHMLGIIRDCAPFIRSATTLQGEDPLPVGWADPDKPLTDREKFIAMGRIRPRRGSTEKSLWDSWSAIRRNIWLWHETNLLLVAAQEAFPDRVRLCRFETFKNDPDRFWQTLSALFELPEVKAAPKTTSNAAVNKKPAGYQVGPPDSWATEDRHALETAQADIDERAKYEC